MIRTLHIVLALLFVIACKRSDTVEQHDLYGRWDIVKADRNGKETGYLRGGYFIINENGSMTVNITGEDETGPYVMDRNRMTTENGDVYEIESLDADSMVINYTAPSNGQFTFYMAKKQEDAQ